MRASDMVSSSAWVFVSVPDCWLEACGLEGCDDIRRSTDISSKMFGEGDTEDV